MYLECCAAPTFAIKDEAAAGSQYGEYVEVMIKDEAARTFRSSHSHEIGIIVAHSPHPIGDARWFFCAGIGPAATLGAGIYLSENWHDLLKTTGGKDFICVLSVAKMYNRIEVLFMAVDCKIIKETLKQT